MKRHLSLVHLLIEIRHSDQFDIRVVVVDISLDIFNKSMAAKVLNAGPEKMVDQAFSASKNYAATAKELLAYAKGNEAAEQGIKKAISEHIFDSSKVTAEGFFTDYKISLAKLTKQLIKFKPALQVMYKKEPEKSLVVALKKFSGRNNSGKITVRHKGGGAKKKYRIIDFKRTKDDIPAKVSAIEYDPNRSANIALLVYADGEKRYILAPNKLKVGDVIVSGAGSDIKVGNSMPLSSIPVGTMIHNVELKPGKGGQLVRSAGNSAQLMAKEGKYAQVRLPSSEVRMVRIECRATIGQVGNIDHENIKVGKAGKSRHMGIRPTVRGSVMNPNDHPHGGGEGRAPIGRPSPVTPWGKPTMGYKTRKKNKTSDKYIVRPRKKK